MYLPRLFSFIFGKGLRFELRIEMLWLKIEMLRSYNKYMVDFWKDNQGNIWKWRKKKQKNITQQNLLSLRKRKSTTFNPGPTPSLPSLIPTEVKVQSGKCRQEHRDPSAPGSQSKVTVSPWLQLLQTLLIPSSSTLKKLYSRLELLLRLISSTQLSFIG